MILHLPVTGLQWTWNNETRINAVVIGDQMFVFLIHFLMAMIQTWNT